MPGQGLNSPWMTGAEVGGAAGIGIHGTTGAAHTIEELEELAASGDPTALEHLRALRATDDR